MIRQFVLGLGACAIAFLAVGCDKAASTVVPTGPNTSDLERMKAQGMKGVEAAGAALSPEALTKSVDEAMPKVEEKIKGLTGDKLKTATDLLETVKKMFAEFKAAPKEKMAALIAPLMEKLTALKTSVGL